MVVKYFCMANDCEGAISIKAKTFQHFVKCPICQSAMEIEMLWHCYPDIKDPRLKEMHIRSDLSEIARCPFTYDCYLLGKYTTSCESQHFLTHDCLVHFDTQLAHISDVLEKILNHLEK